MLDHITIRASDRAASELFYDTVLRTIGIEQSGRDEQYSVWGGDFSLAHADEENPVTRRLHVGFVAPSREHVDEFWRAGREAGYATRAGRDRERRTGRTTTVPLLDPDGNSVEDRATGPRPVPRHGRLAFLGRRRTDGARPPRVRDVRR